MYNCEKCIHEELCDQPGRQLWGHLTKETDCSDFKDRQNYVEVVRCKDCTYWDKAVVNKKGFLICPASGMEIQADDFCSYGERRTE